VHQLKSEGLKAEEVIPIQHSGQVVAVLVVGSHALGEIPQRSRQALDAFAAQAGGAITRIRTEQLLQANRQLLDKTLNSLHDGVLLLEAKTGIVQECNKAANRIFGYARDEMIGRTPDFLHPAEALLEQLSRHLPVGTHDQGFRGEFELRMKRKDGSLFPTEHSLTAIKDESGELISWVNVVRDITERTRVEGELRQLSQRIIEAQEAERSRVARELHDGVNQIIASAKMRLRKGQDLALSPAAREILARCDRLLVQALEENRRIAHNLRPSELDELGLACACRNFCKELQSRADLVVTCRITRLKERMSPTVELNLFRVVQEALSNIEKHAQAKTARLELKIQNGSVWLDIRDDGIGFDLQRAKAHKRSRVGLGLSNMRERCAALGGTYEIQSARGKGTTIAVRVPFEKPSQSKAEK
jgi:PAS domain S-box-containing protein